MRPTPEFATCVDAPFGAREIFKSGAARGRVLTCVRPLLRRVSCRGPRWESRDQVQIKDPRRKRGSVAKFGFGRWSPKAGPMISRAYRCLQARKANFATEPPAVKSRWAGEWGGWGRLSEDGPGQHNPDPSEGPWGGGRPT